MDNAKQKKYKAYRPIDLPERTWPNNKVTKAPAWCSVDLRDGNQALIYPMNIKEKLELYNLLLEVGFKEIEVGFPAASEIEFNFLRTIIEKNLIPNDVQVQILTQARKPLIERSFEALKGVPKAIVHLYNSTSALQRDVVFRMNRQQVMQLAIDGVKAIKDCMKDSDTEITLEYSPESFTGTEPDFAVEISNAVIGEWRPSEKNKIIINLPATVEMTTPNIYADQIEYFCSHVEGRENVIISLHTHNDRGTAVAATELGLLAGADRVEGTLFGNGERTGNVDLVTVALNLFTQGVNPELNFHNINRATEIYQRTTRMKVHPRHPYAGDLVFTAFSGSHQDAINKGLAAYNNGKTKDDTWGVPYLPIDPADIGRTYESIIRINSQSGKGGVAYVMQNDFGCALPKTMHPEFAAIIQRKAEENGGEISPQDIWDSFCGEYLTQKAPFELINAVIQADESDNDVSIANVSLKIKDTELQLQGTGNGPIDAVKNAMETMGIVQVKIKNYVQHSMGEGSDAKAVAFLQIERDEKLFYGVGISPNTSKASIDSLFSALNRAYANSKIEPKLFAVH